MINKDQLPAISQKINEYWDQVESFKGTDGFLVLGLAQSGKSTLINYLMGQDFNFIENEDFEQKLVSTSNPKGLVGPEIGVGNVPKTYVPARFICAGKEDREESYVLCDFAGFLDIRDEITRMTSSIFREESIKKMEYIPGVIVVIAADQINPRELEQLSKILSSMFKKTKISPHKFTFVINKLENFKENAYSRIKKSCLAQGKDVVDIFGKTKEIILTELGAIIETKEQILKKMTEQCSDSVEIEDQSCKLEFIRMMYSNPNTLFVLDIIDRSRFFENIFFAHLGRIIETQEYMKHDSISIKTMQKKETQEYFDFMPCIGSDSYKLIELTQIMSKDLQESIIDIELYRNEIEKNKQEIRQCVAQYNRDRQHKEQAQLQLDFRNLEKMKSDIEVYIKDCEERLSSLNTEERVEPPVFEATYRVVDHIGKNGNIINKFEIFNNGITFDIMDEEFTPQDVCTFDGNEYIEGKCKFKATKIIDFAAGKYHASFYPGFRPWVFSKIAACSITIASGLCAGAIAAISVSGIVSFGIGVACATTTYSILHFSGLLNVLDTWRLPEDYKNFTAKVKLYKIKKNAYKQEINELIECLQQLKYTYSSNNSDGIRKDICTMSEKIEQDDSDLKIIADIYRSISLEELQLKIAELDRSIRQQEDRLHKLKKDEQQLKENVQNKIKHIDTQKKYNQLLMGILLRIGSWSHNISEFINRYKEYYPQEFSSSVVEDSLGLASTKSTVCYLPTFATSNSLLSTARETKRQPIKGQSLVIKLQLNLT